MKIYNEVIVQWDEKTQQYITTYEDSYDYDGEMMLADEPGGCCEIDQVCCNMGGVSNYQCYDGSASDCVEHHHGTVSITNCGGYCSGDEGETCGDVICLPYQNCVDCNSNGLQCLGTGENCSESVGGDSGPTNSPPVADAGPDQTVGKSVEVTLDGSESYDPHSGGDSGEIVQWRWEQTYGPDVSLANADTATPSFTAPSSLD